MGRGPNMRHYAARNVNITVHGVDPNPKMKKYTRKAARKTLVSSKE